MLEAVTLDFWNTLFVDSNGALRAQRRLEVLRDELSAAGLERSQPALDEGIQAGFDFFDEIWLREHRTPLCAEIVDAILLNLRAALPVEARERLTTQFQWQLLDHPPEPMPSLLMTLPVLAGRYRLAVVCDTGFSPGVVIRRLLDRYCLLQYFSYLYFSDEHGVSKPDKRAFHATLDELGVHPSAAAHVGDLQRTDIAGAQAAGMMAVHFIGANDYDAPRSTADAIVRHFEDLPAALGNLVCPGC